jgi:hypothetical protein
MNLKNMPKDKLKIVAATAGLALVFIAIMVTAVIGVTSQIDTSTPDEIAYVQVVTTKPTETTEPVTVETTTEPEIEPEATEEVVIEQTEPAVVEEPSEDAVNNNYENSSWNGEVLNAFNGVVYGPSGKETYYNLDMSGVISIMRSMGNTDEYWIREDGCKMLGDYIMCAANLDVRPRGSLVESSLGTCIVCDTGGFAYSDSYQLDIAVNW